jgi:hypothetical protein
MLSPDLSLLSDIRWKARLFEAEMCVVEAVDVVMVNMITDLVLT